MDVDADGIVSMHATAPPEAPTTRGFASILVQGLTGLTVDEVLAIPADFPQSIGLTRAVSPLRIAGMTGHADAREAPGAGEARRVTAAMIVTEVVPRTLASSRCVDGRRAASGFASDIVRTDDGVCAPQHDHDPHRRGGRVGRHERDR